MGYAKSYAKEYTKYSNPIKVSSVWVPMIRDPL